MLRGQGVLALALCVFISVSGYSAVSGKAVGPDATQVSLFDGSRGTPELNASAGDADDEISVGGDFATGTVVITSTAGVVAANENAMENCTQGSDVELVCEGLFNGAVFVEGGAGSDQIEATIRGESVPFGAVRLALVGGAGRAELIGSSGEDAIRGGLGRDVERGRGGSDSLAYIEDPGRDRFSGGGGADELDASDGGRDRLVDCGGGDRDRAVRDRRDAKAVDCEKVKRN